MNHQAIMRQSRRLFGAFSIVLLASIFLIGCSSTPEITNIAEYENCILELEEAEKFVDEENRSMVRVYATYTNNNEEPLYAVCSFAVRAFQNDVEINDCSDINGGEKALIQEVKNGKSLKVSYVFELSDESEIEILVGTPTANQETVGKQLYQMSDE